VAVRKHGVQFQPDRFTESSPYKPSSPRYRDFERGLLVTIEWYRNHEDWWAPAKDATEAFYARLGQ